MSLRNLVACFFIILIAPLFIRPAAAFVNEGWDWHLVNGEPKRTLHYCAGRAVRIKQEGRSVDVQAFAPGLPPNWAVWLTEAVNNLNNANTGWRLVPSNATFPPCQVLILLGDISETTHGGGVSTPRDTNGDGKADLNRIVIDQNLEETLKNVGENQDSQDGDRDGWSTIAGEPTRNPIGALMHELTHAMRLDHHPDSSHSDTSDNDISDPRKPGDHDISLSEEDINELRQSAGTQESVGQFELQEGEQEIEYANVMFRIPEGAFEFYPAFLDVNVYDGVAIPDPLAINYDGDMTFTHILGSGTIYFRTFPQLLKPITISIPYTDEELEGGPGMYIGDLHNYIPPALEESTMHAFQYHQRPFFVETEEVNEWAPVENSQVDTKNNRVTFETQETGIFGIAAVAATEKTSPLGTENKTVFVIVVVILAGSAYYFIRRAKKK